MYPMPTSIRRTAGQQKRLRIKTCSLKKTAGSIFVYPRFVFNYQMIFLQSFSTGKPHKKEAAKKEEKAKIKKPIQHMLWTHLNVLYTVQLFFINIKTILTCQAQNDAALNLPAT